MKCGIACCNSIGARSKTLRSVVRSLRFPRASTDLTAIVHRNPSAPLSSHLSCVWSHRPSLNRPCHHHSKIKHTKCVLYELFVDWATKRRTQRLDHGHGELSTTQSSFGYRRSIPTVQPDFCRTTLRQLSTAIASGVTTNPPYRCRCSASVAQCSAFS